MTFANEHANLLKKISLFERLSDKQLEIVAKYTHLVQFNKGQVIIQQGRQSDGLFIITQGKVSVNVCLFSDTVIHLGMLGVNDYFGEVTLLSDCGASASVTAETATQCLLLTKSYYQVLRLGFPKIDQVISQCIIKTIQTRIHSISKQVIGSLDDMQELHGPKAKQLKQTRITPKKVTQKFLKKYQQTLFHIDFFHQFTEHEQAQLIKYMAYFEAKRGSVICRAGENSQAAFIVVMGAVQQTATRRNKTSKLSVCGPGDYFGVLSLYDSSPRISNTVVREDALLLRITLKQFQRMRKENMILWYKCNNLFYESLGQVLFNVNKQLVRIKAQQMNKG